MFATLKPELVLEGGMRAVFDKEAQPQSGQADRTVRLRDLMSPASYDRDGNDLTSRGLYLDLPPWSYHVFEMSMLP